MTLQDKAKRLAEMVADFEALISDARDLDVVISTCDYYPVLHQLREAALKAKAVAWDELQWEKK